MNSARSSGRGMPEGRVRPSAASAATVSNSSSIRSAGVTRTRTMAGSSPALAEPVVGARLDHHEITQAGGHRAQALAEPHDPFADLEAFLLARVDMPAGHPPVRLHHQVELQQLAVGLSCGGMEDEPFPADRVDQNLPPKRHRDPLPHSPSSGRALARRRTPFMQPGAVPPRRRPAGGACPAPRGVSRGRPRPPGSRHRPPRGARRAGKPVPAGRSADWPCQARGTRRDFAYSRRRRRGCSRGGRLFGPGGLHTGAMTALVLHRFCTRHGPGLHSCRLRWRYPQTKEEMWHCLRQRPKTLPRGRPPTAISRRWLRQSTCCSPSSSGGAPRWPSPREGGGPGRPCLLPDLVHVPHVQAPAAPTTGSRWRRAPPSACTATGHGSTRRRGCWPARRPPGREEAGPSTPWPARRPDLAGLPAPRSAAGVLRAAALRRGRRASGPRHHRRATRDVARDIAVKPSRAAPPEGVRADSSPGGSSVRLCTIVANLTTGEAVLLGRGGGGDHPARRPRPGRGRGLSRGREEGRQNRAPARCGAGGLARGSMVSTSEPISNVVISMTANQSRPRPRALQAVRRAARALKPINDQQVRMWEAFWQAGYPSDQ